MEAVRVLLCEEVVTCFMDCVVCSWQDQLIKCTSTQVAGQHCGRSHSSHVSATTSCSFRTVQVLCMSQLRYQDGSETCPGHDTLWEWRRRVRHRKYFGTAVPDEKSNNFPGDSKVEQESSGRIAAAAGVGHRCEEAGNGRQRSDDIGENEIVQHKDTEEVRTEEDASHVAMEDRPCMKARDEDGTKRRVLSGSVGSLRRKVDKLEEWFLEIHKVMQH